MPTLGAPLDFAKLEGRNIRAHQLGAAPSSPVTGQLYYNTGDNTLYWYDGTAWISARGGAAAIGDATPSTKGIVQLAGDLSGTAASPQIAAGVITDAEVAPANKDGGSSVPSLRTLGMSSVQAMNGANSLYLIAASNPSTSAITASGQKITNLADPVASTDAANKNYVDNVAQGLDVKMSVRLLSRGNISVSSAPTNIDATPANSGDRILLIGQTVPAENGIYVYNGAGVAMTRALDMNTWLEVPGAFTFVETGGVQNAETGWVCTSDTGGTLGTTAITWAQFSGAGEYIGGNGLTLTGTQFDVGAGSGITVAADTVGITPNGITTGMFAPGAINLSTGAGMTGVLGISLGGTAGATPGAARSNLKAAGYYDNAATHGAGTTISIPFATHSVKAGRALIVQVQDNATGNVELPDISVSSGGDVTITYAVAVAANSKLVTIAG